MNLIFLHGFLGSHEDWSETQEALPSTFICHFPPDIDQLIPFLETHQIQNCILVGYSMGGRAALKYKESHPELFFKTIIISAHTGLKDPIERKKRMQKESKWIEMLKTESLETFLKSWYAQPLFENLKSKPLFEDLLKRRLKNDPKLLAATLKKNRLSFQKPFQAYDRSMLFICGEKDLAYRTLYKSLPSVVRTEVIENSGHAPHLENPKALAKEIEIHADLPI